VSRRALTSAASAGRLFTDIDLTLDRRTRDVAQIRHTNVATFTEGRQPEADVQALIDRYDELSRPLRQTPVGKIATDIREIQDDSLEDPLGNLIADAQLADTDDPNRGAADLALMNPGGVRADLIYASSPAGEGDGVVTYEEAFTVQPFNNIVTTQTFTGAQLLNVLKDQWCGPVAESQVVLLPSKSLTYTYSKSGAAAIADKDCATAVNPVSNVKVNGQDLGLATTYRVTTNNFLADGGDGFQSLRAGTNRTSLTDFDIDSLVRYMQPSLAPGAPAIEAPDTDRIDVLP
jgi:5'-nucleotidase